METKFYSKKSRSFGQFLIASNLFIALVVFGMPVIMNGTLTLMEFVISGLLVILVAGLFLWIWNGTYYQINNKILKAKTGPLVWRVPINEISIIRLNQETIGGTWKPTLSWKCIEIKYKRLRAIFISPENEREFLDILLQVNPKIDIKQK